MKYTIENLRNLHPKLLIKMFDKKYKKFDFVIKSATSLETHEGTRLDQINLAYVSLKRL